MLFCCFGVITYVAVLRGDILCKEIALVCSFLVKHYWCCGPELPWQCAEQNNMRVRGGNNKDADQCWLVDALNSVITQQRDGAEGGGGMKRDRDRERGLLRVISDGGQLLALFTEPSHPMHEGAHTCRQ